MPTAIGRIVIQTTTWKGAGRSRSHCQAEIHEPVVAGEREREADPDDDEHREDPDREDSIRLRGSPSN